MKRIFRRKKKSASEAGSIGSGLSGSAYNISPKKDLGKLHRAAFEGDLTKLKTLLKRGDVNQLDKENRTALHLACSSGKFEAVRLLCDHPNINLNLCDNERRSALMKCVQCEHLTCLKILLNKEADVSLCDINGNTALHIASSIPNIDICYLLSDYNADPRAKNKDGAAAHHIAASLGSDEIVKLLLGLGVDVDEQDVNQKTALMNAAQKGHLPTVKLLLSNNANSALRDLNGWTADDYASMDGFHPISHIILEHNSRKGTPSAASRQSSLSKTPQTTPQRLGLQSGAVGIGGSAMDTGSEDESQNDYSFSTSRATDGKESWASSQSDEEEAKYAELQKKKSEAKPKINVLQALNLRKKKNPDIISPTPSDNAAPSSPSSQAPQSPPKATTNLFLTTSAREQLEKQKLEEDPKNDDVQDQETRTRYDSKSARGLPVSPTNPPLPKPRSNQSLDKMDSPGTKYVPSKPTDEDSPWDSSENESDDDDPRHTTPAMKVSDQKSGSKPNERLMQQLGLDDSELKNLYSVDESSTEHSHSEAAPVITKSPTKTKDTLTVKKVLQGAKQKKIKDDDDASDSWDESFSENANGDYKDGEFNFLQGSSGLKFDDETESDADVIQPPKNTAVKPYRLIRNNDDEDNDDSSSWNSDNLVERPEDAPTKHKYVSSPLHVLKDAEKMVSPKHKPGLQQEIAERERKERLEIGYGARLSGEDSESEIESESLWEQENRAKKQQTLNNEKDVVKERKRMEEEEEQKIRDEELRKEEERKKKQHDEEERRREEEERKKKQHDEEERRREEEERIKKQHDEEERKKKQHDEEESRREEEERIKKQHDEEERRREEEEQKKKQHDEEERRREEEERKKKQHDEEERRREEEEQKKKQHDEEERRREEEERKKKQHDEEESMREEEERKKKQHDEEERRREEEERKKKQHDEEERRREEEEQKKKQHDEEERRREEEEQKKKQHDEEERRREEEERKKKQHDEEERRREEEERGRLELKRKEEEIRKEEDQRKLQEKRKWELEEEEEKRKKCDLEELERLNRMNEELERKNAELRSKSQEEEKRKLEEEEKVNLEATKTSLMNESLRVALERAADVASESGDSGPESIELVERTKPEEMPIVKKDSLAGSSSLLPPFGTTAQHKAEFEVMNQIDLDTLTEETETDDNSSLSESHSTVLRHTSPLSDSLKLAEEKQSLSLRLVKEQDVSAMAQEKLEKIQKENKQLKFKERALIEERKTWELEKVDFVAENRKLSFDVKNMEENVETINLKLSKQAERCKRMEEQLQVEREERREQEVLIRDLRIEHKNANAAMKQTELECEELRKTLATERQTRTLAQTMNEDNFKLNETLENEALKDDKVESLEQVVLDKNQELIRVKAERDRYEDTSARYKAELSKLRSEDADQHGNLVQLNEELNERLDEKELELREGEEALQLAALQSVQFKQAYENCARQLADEQREKENVAKDLEMLNSQQTQLKRDLEDSRSSYLREQERSRKLEDSQERMREKETDFQGKLLSAETKVSRLENELQIAQSSNKQRAEDTAKWENESEKLREVSRESEKNISKLQRELAEQSGKVEVLKIELHQRESECVQMRQEKEDLRSRNQMSGSEQQEKFNTKFAALQRDHENARVAFETRNVQLTQQIEHWKSEVDRIEREKAHKDEELAQAQQDRIETHKKLGYADAFSKSASKEQKHLMEENTKVKENNIRLQSQVSLVEQKLEEKSSTIVDLQKEVDRFYQTSANANRKIETLGESQRLAENSRTKLEQQLKDTELENIRLKSDLDSANSWKEKLQEGREEEAHAKATLEERFSELKCNKVLLEEKLAAEVANSKILCSEADGHKSMWEAEVKSRSKLEVELSKTEKHAEDERNKAELLRNKLTKATEDRKTYKTKYEQLKREKAEADRRAESYRSAMHDAGRKVADTESECESQLSMMDEQYSADKTRRETTVAKLREQVADLAQQLKEKRRLYFSEGPTEHSIGADEMKRAQFENEKLREELKQLRVHVQDSYVDKSELETARQNERIKAQAAIAPTLDQVNSFLKNQQLKHEFLDQVREKREEGTMMGAMLRITALEEQLKTERRRHENADLRRFHQEEAELSQHYENTKRENETLKQQLSRSTNKAEEYKGYWMKERKKFQNFFSNTLGGSLVPNATDASDFSATNGLPFSPSKLGGSPLGGAFSSTPKKDTSDPLLAQVRSKLDATIAQHLNAARESSPHSASHINGQFSVRSSAGTPRSSHPHDVASTSGHKQPQNEYASFLLT